MTYFLEKGQNLPHFDWIQKSYDYDNAKLVAGSPFSALEGRMWITCRASDSNFAFSFVVEGGYEYNDPRWSFSGIHSGEISVSDIDNGDDEHGTKGKYVKFDVLTDDGARLYRFVISSLLAVPSSVRKISGTTFGDGEKLTIYVFHSIVSRSNGMTVGNGIMRLDWHEKIVEFENSVLLKSKYVKLPSGKGRMWITMRTPTYSCSFLVNGGWFIDQPMWTFDALLTSSHPTTSNVRRSGVDLFVRLDAGANNANRVMMFRLNSSRVDELSVMQLSGDDYSDVDSLAVNVFYVSLPD